MVKVLIGVDGSAIAKSAFKFYLDTFYKENDEILVMYVVPPLAVPAANMIGVTFPTDLFQETVNEQMKETKALEKFYADECSKRNLKHHTVMFHQGGENPGEFIVDFAKQKKMEMIVIGTRGMGKIRRTILGSVSDYVLHHTKIPVIIIPQHNDK